jgi:L,D-transpeptidase-like protein
VHRSRRIASLLVVGASLALPAAAHTASSAPSAMPDGAVKLSDERLTTKWAYPADARTIYSRPSGQARKVGRLHLTTEDRFPEVYLVLTRWNDAGGNAWLQIRIPKRPNGGIGWVRAEALGSLQTVHTHLLIDRRALRATLSRDGKVLFTARIGVGKRSTPTPAGHFWIREKFRVKGTTIYGPRAIGTSAYAPYLTDWPGGGVVGLHGTNQPSLIPGRPSHGCIRLRNRDILRLYRLAPRGTPIEIV